MPSKQKGKRAEPTGSRERDLGSEGGNGGAGKRLCAARGLARGSGGAPADAGMGCVATHITVDDALLLCPTIQAR